MWNETQADGRTESARQRLSILIADDHSGSRRCLQLLVRWLGCDPDVATDGREALEATRARHYDIILMDVVMPRMGGPEATRQIRQERAFAPGLRIVGMSADSTPENHEICLAAGMDDFLSKPIDIDSLIRIVDEVVMGLEALC